MRAPLTDEQRHKLGDNWPLIAYAIGRANAYSQSIRRLPRQLKWDVAIMGGIRAVRGHDPARGSLSTIMVLGIVRHLMSAVEQQDRDRRRSKAGMPRRCAVNPVRDLESAEWLAHCLTRAEAACRPRDWAMLSSHYLRGESWTDIAARYGVTKQRVVQLAHRAIRHAQAAFDEWEIFL